MIGAIHSLYAQTVVSSNYAQNFDGLASSGLTNTWTQDASISEWWAYRFPASPGNAWFDVTNYIANDGNLANGSLYSFGQTGSSERALGSIGSGNTASGDFRYGTGFTNGFASAITSLSISYRGETWRVGTATNSNNVDFQYSLTATGVNDNEASWIDFDGLDFAQTISAVPGPQNGNANFVLKSDTINALSISVGSTIWIRWTDIDHDGADHGLAIDDLNASFTTQPVPEPASMVALGLGALALMRRKRR
ncbi:MAG: PEP-CTERM sorting domain-containing protein [Chlorobia bacterium]|nr:PEP-CTERM sorting domain-containing protein [Fimbriimonadaceae bacterium]